MTQKDDDARLDQSHVVEGLEKIAEMLKDLNTKCPDQKHIVLSHYQTIPVSVEQSYEILNQGAGLVHATATKYTLMGKLDATEQAKMSHDLLQGCQYLATGCLSIHDAVTGCSRSVRYHVRQACRAIITTVIQLVQAFCGDHYEEALESDSTIGAQKTGAVWQTCNVILEKKLPVGNRNAMRRDLMTYAVECNETIEEFQQIVDAGPALKEEEEKIDDAGDDDDWLDFLDGAGEQYTEAEMAVALGALGLIKCSKNSLNATLKACDAVGNQLHSDEDFKVEFNANRLTWISGVHDLARAVGDGVTDLGACLYPPISDLQTLETQMNHQADAIETLVNHIVDASAAQHGTIELPLEATSQASKLQGAVANRRRDAMEALQKLKE